MGSARPRPARLAEKLLQIRLALGISQTEMLYRLGLEDKLKYTRMSDYELGRNEPSLMVLLQYARVANLYMEALVDDEVDLPERLPSPTKTEGIRRKTTPRTKKR
jgi:transcriptional regulator with XRE-family HTH domain